MKKIFLLLLITANFYEVRSTELKENSKLTLYRGPYERDGQLCINIESNSPRFFAYTPLSEFRDSDLTFYKPGNTVISADIGNKIEFILDDTFELDKLYEEFCRKNPIDISIPFSDEQNVISKEYHWVKWQVEEVEYRDELIVQIHISDKDKKFRPELKEINALTLESFKNSNGSYKKKGDTITMRVKGFLCIFRLTQDADLLAGFLKKFIEESNKKSFCIIS